MIICDVNVHRTYVDLKLSIKTEDKVLTNELRMSEVSQLFSFVVMAMINMVVIKHV